MQREHKQYFSQVVVPYKFRPSLTLLEPKYSYPAWAYASGGYVIRAGVHIHNVYMTYCTSKSGIWRDISWVVSYFHEPKASANTAYE